MVVFETFALMKFLKKEGGYEHILKTLQEGGVVSEATLYELLYVVVRDFLGQGKNPDESLRKTEEIIDSLCLYLKKQNLSNGIAQQAAFFKIKYNKLNLSHFDCLALATAFALKMPLCSGEKGLAQVKEVKMIV